MVLILDEKLKKEIAEQILAEQIQAEKEAEQQQYIEENLEAERNKCEEEPI